MKKKNLSQHNAGILELSEEQLDQITGGFGEFHHSHHSHHRHHTDGTYTVQQGDNLSAIAAREFGSSAKWNQLYEKNKKVIGNNPNLILPGQKLNLDMD